MRSGDPCGAQPRPCLGRGAGSGRAAMAPLGMSISAHTFLARHSRELTAIVIGIFMHISTTILFESSEIHRFQWAKLAALAFGLPSISFFDFVTISVVGASVGAMVILTVTVVLAVPTLPKRSCVFSATLS